MVWGLATKLAVGGAIGGAGLLGGLLLGGGTKKEQTVAQAQEQEMATVIHPYGVYTPTYAPTVSEQIDYTFAPTIQIESPAARGAVVTTKKETTQTPTFTITPTISPTQEAGQAATQGMGIDILPIAVVATVGIIAYALLVKKKGGKKK